MGVLLQFLALISGTSICFCSDVWLCARIGYVLLLTCVQCKRLPRKANSAAFSLAKIRNGSFRVQSEPLVDLNPKQQTTLALF
jgi:hypothetical protein